jgi:4-aminobutyrate aminotransferase
VACAAALATLDVIRDERLVDNSAERGAQLTQALLPISGPMP